MDASVYQTRMGMWAGVLVKRYEGLVWEVHILEPGDPHPTVLAVLPSPADGQVEEWTDIHYLPPLQSDAAPAWVIVTGVSPSQRTLLPIQASALTIGGSKRI